MKKLAFCLIITLLLFTLLPLQRVGATTVKTDSLLVTKPFQYTENKPVRLKTIMLYPIEKSTPGLSEKGISQAEENGIRHRRNDIKGTLYISYGIELIITLLVIVLL
jgi:hypothetical protein